MIVPLQLNAELEERIEKEVKAGSYSSTNEVVAAATDLLDAQKRTIREELNRRYEDVAAGRVEPIDGEEALARLRRKSDERRRADQ